MVVTRNKYNQSLEIIKIKVIECAQNIQNDFLEWSIESLHNEDYAEFWNDWLNVLKHHRPDIIEARKQEHWLERLYIISCQFTEADTLTILDETFSSKKECKKYEYCDMQMWYDCYAGDCA